MSVITGKLFLQKDSSNKLSATIVDKHVKEIVGATTNRASASGVKATHEPVITIPTKNGFNYSFILNVGRQVQRSEATAQKNLAEAKKFIIRAAEMRGWQCRDGQDAEEAKNVAADRPLFMVPKLTPSVMDEAFKGIYERQPHIRIIQDSVETAIATNFEERNHILLYGPPAVCKTLLFKKFKSLYEQNGDIERVSLINSTTTSKAGIETWILEKAKDKILPEILCFDEIEKFSLDNLNCLLQIMDGCGTISRTNAKIGRQQAEAKVLIFASCNDEKKLQEFASGALWSRFTTRLACARPKRDLMRSILINSLQERINNGEEGVKLEWADAAIDYAFDKMKTNDPREVRSLLSGRDRLLDGSYFKDLQDIKNSYEQSITGKI